MQSIHDEPLFILFIEKKAGTSFAHLSDETTLQIPSALRRAFRLKEGMRINKDALLDRIRQQSYPAACNRAASLLSIRSRSVHEISSALERCGFDPETTEKAVTYFKALDYLNDETFTRNWIRARSAKGIGANRIRSELLQKGIPRDLIQGELESAKEPGSFSESALEKCLTKAVRNRDLSDPNEKRKVIQYAMRRGFSYQEAKAGLDDIVSSHCTE